MFNLINKERNYKPTNVKHITGRYETDIKISYW